MTEDNCVYTVRVGSEDSIRSVREHVHNSSVNEDFSAEIRQEKIESGETVFKIEVNGDAYEIPVFEEGFAEIPEADVLEGDVSIGESKFSD